VPDESGWPGIDVSQGIYVNGVNKIKTNRQILKEGGVMKGSTAINVLASAFAALALAAPAHAGWLDNTTVTPVVGVTASNLDYRRAAASDNRKTSLNSLSLSLGVAGEKWYGRLNTELPLAPGFFLGGAGGAQAIKRTDYSLTGGYAVTPSISLFGGYLYTLINMSASSGFVEDQTDNGPFIGSSWEMYRGKASSVSVNVAYANLNGSATRTTAPATVNFDVTGPTTGLSYGISWTGQLGRDGRTYVLSYKIQDFKFEGTGTGGPQTITKGYGVLTLAVIL